MRQQVLSRFFAPVSSSSNNSSSATALSSSSSSSPSPASALCASIPAPASASVSASASASAAADAVQVTWPPRSPRKRKRAASSAAAPLPSASSRHARFVRRLGVQEREREGQDPGARSQNQGHQSLTPLEAQVVELKAKYPDVLLLVEVGYKYRFFDQDAEVAARVLGIVAHTDHSFLTASIPTFRLHVHVRRLVEAGYKVGVVRQTETAAIKAHGPNKLGPFSRHLSALYTRATLGAAGGLPEGDQLPPSYLMCVSGASQQAEQDWAREQEQNQDHTALAVVAVDTATGDVLHGCFSDTRSLAKLGSLLLTLSPAEILLAVPASRAIEKLLREYSGPSKQVRFQCVSRHELDLGDDLPAAMAVPGDQQELSLDYQGGVSMPQLVGEAMALAVRYLKEFGLEKLLSVKTAFRPLSAKCEMSLAPNVIQQLEILKNSADQTEKGSLLWLMDHTRTPFGARMLRRWVTHPLCDRELILARLDAVFEIRESLKSAGLLPMEGSTESGKKWSGNANKTSTIGKSVSGKSSGLLASTLMELSRLPDVERGITRVLHRTAAAAEFVGVMEAVLSFSTQLKHLVDKNVEHGFVSDSDANDVEHFGGLRSSLLKKLVAAASATSVSTHASRLLSCLNVDAASAGDQQNLFVCTNNNFPEISSCHLVINGLETDMEHLLLDFRRLLKIPGLQYLSLSGSSYLIEVPASQRVPPDWLKVNSTKKVHRYHPPEVVATLDRLAVAKEELTAACCRAWDKFLGDFASHYSDFRAAVHAMASLDCLLGLAILSASQDYSRPQLVEDNEPCQLIIQAGRHPVLESRLCGKFVPNNTFLHAESEHCQLITGPNMGGKSCYIRQVALIAIMAQIGSYVPAATAKLHVLDAIYTRMGASDSIQHGSSTFFEELSEASFILRNATPRSLVIVDELGRGTSTHDGVAISYATLRYLVKEIKCLVLFVTHYPEVADLKGLFPAQIAPLYVSFLRGGAETANSPASPSQGITFLYKLVPGLAERSFGLHVARLAQIPQECVTRATTLAASLEKSSGDSCNELGKDGNGVQEEQDGSRQLTSLLGSMGESETATAEAEAAWLQLRCVKDALEKGHTAQDTAALLQTSQVKVAAWLAIHSKDTV